MVAKDGKCGIINDQGKEIVPPIYDKIEKFGDYLKEYAVIEINGLKGFLDLDGNVVMQPKYAEINKFDIIRKNWALVKEHKGKMGFIDKSCKEVVQVIYDNIEIFSAKK